MNYGELQIGIEENLPIPPAEELWEAIQNGNLKKYTLKQLEEGMLQLSQSRVNLYYMAAEEGHLDKIPKELLTSKNLLEKSLRGWNCLHRAALNGHLDQIPKELLTKENLLKPSEYRITGFELAVENGHLDQIPQEVLTQEHLLTPNGTGETCLHIAASAGRLNQIPKAFLTTKNLLQPDDSQWTPLHKAARWNHLDKIPPLPYQTLLALKTYFEEKPYKHEHKVKILKFLKEKIQHIQLGMISQSLKQEHKEIL
jgi:hypothetical protein